MYRRITNSRKFNFKKTNNSKRRTNKTDYMINKTRMKSLKTFILIEIKIMSKLQWIH